VSIDMWQAYENSVETNAPQAEIVFDKFHIAKHLNEAVDTPLFLNSSRTQVLTIPRATDRRRTFIGCLGQVRIRDRQAAVNRLKVK